MSPRRFARSSPGGVGAWPRGAARGREVARGAGCVGQEACTEGRARWRAAPGSAGRRVRSPSRPGAPSRPGGPGGRVGGGMAGARWASGRPGPTARVCTGARGEAGRAPARGPGLHAPAARRARCAGRRRCAPSGHEKARVSDKRARAEGEGDQVMNSENGTPSPIPVGNRPSFNWLSCTLHTTWRGTSITTIMCSLSPHSVEIPNPVDSLLEFLQSSSNTIRAKYDGSFHRHFRASAVLHTSPISDPRQCV